MLKSLTLHGFKSFADKTRFDFDAGLTGVVGPNGSGKSNIIDAIRWILGEQSAKSLRGKEMADVIFNGTTNRRAMGMAEVSLAIDNRQRFLPIESTEVVLTRRVYRSGDSEYLINNRIARLKDIKTLFLGTGVGVGAYSIIEQGKVEQILQSSSKDRRFIFEEAAGISKFRLHKIEALRRLERVDINLGRVRDIYDELEKQLRSLRNQAGRARKYKEYYDRHKEFRLTLSQIDYERNRSQLSLLESTINQGHVLLQSIEPEIIAMQAQIATIDQELVAKQEAMNAHKEQSNRARERFHRLQSRLDGDHRLNHELEVSLNRLAQDRRTMGKRLEVSVGALEALERQALEVIAKQGELTKQSASLAAQQTILTNNWTALRTNLAASNDTTTKFIQTIARLENEQAALESQFDDMVTNRQEMKTELAKLKRISQEAIQLSQTHLQHIDLITVQLGRFQTISTDLELQYSHLVSERNQLHDELVNWRQKRVALLSRIDVLENLRSRHEGLAGGVRQAMLRHEQGDLAWTEVIGVLAEQISVPSEYADLVELALGVRSQSILFRTELGITDQSIISARQLPGRVWLTPTASPEDDRLIVDDESHDWPTMASLVDCDREVRPVIDRLLGTVLLAPDLAAAQHALNTWGRQIPNLRFITPDGDLLLSDGTVVTGSKRSELGILARTAELHDHTLELAAIDESISQLEQQLKQVTDSSNAMESELDEHHLKRTLLSSQITQQQRALARNRKHADEILTRMGDLEQALVINARDAAELRITLNDVSTQLNEQHEQLGKHHDERKKWDESIALVEGERQTLQEQANNFSLELAKLEERSAGLSTEQHRLKHESAELEKSLTDIDAQLRDLQDRKLELSLGRLELNSQLADVYADLDQLDRTDPKAKNQLFDLQTKRKEAILSLEKKRAEVDTTRQQTFDAQLELSKLQNERNNLLERLREDYGIDLATLIAEQQTTNLADAEPSSQDRTVESDPSPLMLTSSDGVSLDLTTEAGLTAARIEMNQLKDKMARLGSVNLEAVAELELVENRASNLQIQLEDLTNAKRYLEQVIAKLDEESKRLFLDTFDNVRGHFQEMFRKLFGGGKGDVLLENPADPLETGIEIIARPPGKEPRSISLLSGGEKTLTATSLLMALFRSKPSPWCILDEVDAALDEANIGRFITMVKDFSEQTQFVVITHSKTTMACVDMLHGVTQREPGVSLRVSVKLSDVAEDGRILETAGEPE